MRSDKLRSDGVRLQPGTLLRRLESTQFAWNAPRCWPPLSAVCWSRGATGEGVRGGVVVKAGQGQRIVQEGGSRW